MLGVQPTMFAHGLFVRYEKKNELRILPKIFLLERLKMSKGFPRWSRLQGAGRHDELQTMNAYQFSSSDLSDTAGQVRWWVSQERWIPLTPVCRRKLPLTHQVTATDKESQTKSCKSGARKWEHCSHKCSYHI